MPQANTIMYICVCIYLHINTHTYICTLNTVVVDNLIYYTSLLTLWILVGIKFRNFRFLPYLFEEMKNKIYYISIRSIQYRNDNVCNIVLCILPI